MTKPAGGHHRHGLRDIRTFGQRTWRRGHDGADRRIETAPRRDHPVAQVLVGEYPDELVVRANRQRAHIMVAHQRGGIGNERIRIARDRSAMREEFPDTALSEQAGVPALQVAHGVADARALVLGKEFAKGGRLLAQLAKKVPRQEIGERILERDGRIAHLAPAQQRGKGKAASRIEMRGQVFSRQPQFDRSRTHDIKMFIVSAARQDFLPGAIIAHRHPAYGGGQRVAVEGIERGRLLEERPDIAQLADHSATIARLAPFGVSTLV